jgi:hypothetical protein
MPFRGPFHDYIIALSSTRRLANNERFSILFHRLKKRKKYYPRRNSCENHVVSRSVYELEHPVPGKEEAAEPGNGVLEVSAPPSVDLGDDNSGKGSIGCSTLSGKSADSDLKKFKDSVGEESLVMYDNVLYEEMDEIDEVTPGSPSLYATMERGRKMWVQPPEQSDCEEADRRPATLEKGPSLIFHEGHDTTLTEGQNMTVNEDSPLTLNEGESKQINEVRGYQGQGHTEQRTVAPTDNAKESADKEKSLIDCDTDLGIMFNVPEYARVNKPKLGPSDGTLENMSSCGSEDDAGSDNSELVFGKGSSSEPDYEEIKCPPESHLDPSFQPLIPPDGTGKAENHCGI